MIMEDYRVYSGFPGCKRDEGTTVSGVLATITSIVLIIQLVFNIANSNNNENKKNENNNNNNNNNNVDSFNNIFISMNENMNSASMNSMLGRSFKDKAVSPFALYCTVLKYLSKESIDQKKSVVLKMYTDNVSNIYKC
ncbi:GATA zinc finger domain-containing protein 8 [Eurytemora carolleeae]|uniref:GATA zinc finger domain-containing protein 8 n=1 Tax=Eurytemora carolleeae TaxID=1294199 RepID=UPI000C77F203|nr:GATA zinc finger domain-containing protein 8 [Eurytemora carolleeae]XP_023336791.1 GATA zinc finger domain-containing protein 8 [Eurytemora carolleeae]|eukprot:XP_023336790.1 GATA zinc finger domain-containing protein 8-like [Eurytemora affinis]